MPLTAPPRPSPSQPASASGVRSLIDEFIAEHRELSAVGRFSRWHDHHAAAAVARIHTALLPAAPPGPGQQFAFEVDLDACSGCKACVTACHALNGLDDHEAWRSVGLLVSRSAPACRADASPPLDGSSAAEAPQHVTTACHHCLDPACLAGCPVLAYEKDPRTGIVRHLDDQCIGCSYCTMMCPYDVPKYSDRLGIVRKCDLCAGRLAAQQAPACAQACPNGAIRITVTDTETVHERFGAPNRAERIQAFLPESPDPAFTLPTTRFLSRRRHQLAAFEAADSGHLAPAPAHRPLVALLCLSQISVGLVLAELFGLLRGFTLPAPARLVTLLAAGTAFAASAAHLGQPRKAWRAFLGWRRSWLTREILALSLFGGALAFHTANASLGQPRSPFVSPTLGAAVAATLGLLGVATSVMVYAATGRRGWSIPHTAPRFGGTIALAAALGTACAFPSPRAWYLFAFLTVIKLAAECASWCSRDPELRRSARLLQGPLRARFVTRLCLAAGSLLAAGVAVADLSTAAPAAAFAVATFAAGEWTERDLFFRAAAPRRMPGQP